jgi:glycerol-3-phosphate O-acyltransferase
MLGMTVRSFLRDTRRAVAYVPVYFGYDRLLEGEGYIDELMGRPKKKESVGGLFGALPELRKELGRVYVSFGEPLLLGAKLDEIRPDWRQVRFDEDSRPAWFGDAVDAVAGEVMRRINAAAAVTPVNLLSVALLAAPRQAMLETDLEKQLQLYIDLLKAFPYSPDVSVNAADGASIVATGERMGMLERLGLLERDAEGWVWRRSTTGSAEAVRLSVLAQATIQTVERYYLAIALLLHSGPGVLAPDALEQRCVAMAQRMSMLYGLAAPEFFDKAMFRDFIELLRARGVIRLDGDGKLTYDDALLAVADDARIVLSEQIRNSILQVTHS